LLKISLRCVQRTYLHCEDQKGVGRGSARHKFNPRCFSSWFSWRSLLRSGISRRRRGHQWIS